MTNAMGPAGVGPGPGSELESEPELYPDVVADGGLAAAMKRIAAASGLTLGEVEDVHYPHLPGIRFGATVPGRERLTVTAIRTERRFLVDNTMAGVAHARGYASDLNEVVRAAAAWHAGADPRGMQAVAAFIDLPLVAEARATGSAELVVEAVWQSRMMSSRRLMEQHSGGRCEQTALRSQPALFDAAYAQPRLRRLYPVTSHFSLWFSRCTDFPYARASFMIEPLPGGDFKVRWRSGPSETFTTAQEAVARAVDLLPPDIGPAVLGTRDDVPD